MRTPDCAQVRQALDAFLEGELRPRQAELVRAHLEQCPECRRQRQWRQELLADLRP